MDAPTVDGAFNFIRRAIASCGAERKPRYHAVKIPDGPFIAQPRQLYREAIFYCGRSGETNGRDMGVAGMLI